MTCTLYNVILQAKETRILNEVLSFQMILCVMVPEGIAQGMYAAEFA